MSHLSSISPEFQTPTRSRSRFKASAIQSIIEMIFKIFKFPGKVPSPLLFTKNSPEFLFTGDMSSNYIKFP